MISHNQTVSKLTPGAYKIMQKNVAFAPVEGDDERNRSIGVSVVRQEARALALLADSLDMNFDLAVRAILATSGRVVVSGMGKAGHVEIGRAHV